MAKKLYVGNLPFSCTDDKLRSAFEEYGAVDSARIVQDQATGRSKGFGFVEMQNDDDANKAIDGLNKKDFEGRVLTVNEARPRNSDGGGQHRGGSHRNGSHRDGGSRGYNNKY